MKPYIGLIAEAALGELHYQAKRVERVAMWMSHGFDRAELVWIPSMGKFGHANPAYGCAHHPAIPCIAV